MKKIIPALIIFAIIFLGCSGTKNTSATTHANPSNATADSIKINRTKQ